MASHKKYWKSIEELKPDSKVVPTLKQKEFAEQLPVGRFFRQKDKLEASSTSRRDFLKFVGFSTAAAGLAACEGPVKKSIPYIVQPEQIRPGVANYYATSIADGYDFANMLVKTVEGRPVKIQYNTLASNRFSPNTRVLASVLSLYDSLRIQAPKCGDNYTSWGALDAATLDAIKKAKEAGKEVVLLTQTFASPTTETLIKNFSDTFGGVRHVSYDAVSYKAATNAFEKVYGIKALADYDLSKADVIVSFGADFLADWQGGGFDAAYAKGRIPKDGKMSFHVQIESNMTLSGANADRRLSLKPSQQKVALAVFYGYLSGVSIDSSLPEKVKAALKKTAKRVKETGSNAVVITGIQDENAQLLVLEINRMLKSEVMDTDAPILSRQGDCDAVTELVEDMNKGKVGVLITSGVNPAYTLPNSNDFIP